jgi:hypothetical protein
MARRRVRRAACLLATALLVTLLLAGCGSDSNNASGRDKGDDTTETSLGPGKESDYVGLTKAQAMKKAKDQGRPARVTREDDEMFPGTLDYNPDRVNLELDDGTVTKATFG